MSGNVTRAPIVPECGVGRVCNSHPMRSTCSVYIDAGYLLAAAATRTTGTSLRSGIHVDYTRLVQSLVDVAESWSSLPVLRVHWYDSAPNGVPDAQQERIGELSKVKLRLGRFGFSGEQKGVDLRIGLDLVTHARHNASDIFFVVSGDDDLTEAVEEAQVHGVQVVLLAVPTSDDRPHGVNRHLVRAADDIETIPGGAIDAATLKVDRAVTPVPPTNPAATEPSRLVAAKPAPQSVPTPRDLAAISKKIASPQTASVLAYSGSTDGASHVLPGYDDDATEIALDAVTDRVVKSILESATPQAIEQLTSTLTSTHRQIPPEIDRALLQDASDALGLYDLDHTTRYRLRDLFWLKYDQSKAGIT